ncbi:TetR/AcrR family transcriptional regulator [Nocardia implantans]|uniref:TetR/AcrR family transcriptional regulator n=1 Tax=Nocardia implantans TaxID=3108168 RepID=A0ABU6B4Y5_9NOCA|nr:MULTISPECIES: TetR/AcrR family transcriptional regulator [unclassified Nocardia]MEA3528647.1 TetR/AcrR family transcriptional regulator [Nocardia sp. CDC192]MEB3514759.1 TetR/AcrR family transcriptional regulator [Nocardia sp. CDC186]
MANLGPGRPRLEQRRRRGSTPRAEILDAAGELFTTNGYANTSTRAIADAVGIRQASLYHHFAAKDDILDALLAETVAAPIELAHRLRAASEPPPVRLYALALFDVRQLCASRWNLGALYLLPELRTERFAAFRLRRDELRSHYEALAAQVLAEVGAVNVPGTESLPFRLVETVISIRSDEGTAPRYAERAIPGAVLRTLGWSGDLDPVRAEAAVLLDRLASPTP